jgi:hypothetical protein
MIDRMRWLLLALCACNRVLGLGDVGVRDAHFFDGIDTQAYCPSAVDVAPQFSPVLHQIIGQDCESYQIGAAGFAIAYCQTGTDIAVVQGQIDEPLRTQAVGIPAASADHSWGGLRLSPEGDTVFFDDYDINTNMATHRTYTYQGGATWAAGPDLPLPAFGHLTVPTLGPHRHVLVTNDTTSVDEWVQDGATTWHQVRTFDVGLLVHAAWLGSDGLRAALVVSAVAIGPRSVVYVARASIDDAFAAAIAVPSLPGVLDLFITADCTRAYMSSVGSIFYASQI